MARSNLIWTRFVMEHGKDFPHMIRQWSDFRDMAVEEEAAPLVDLADCALWEVANFDITDRPEDDVVDMLEALDLFEDFCVEQEAINQATIEYAVETAEDDWHWDPLMETDYDDDDFGPDGEEGEEWD